MYCFICENDNNYNVHSAEMQIQVNSKGKDALDVVSADNYRYFNCILSQFYKYSIVHSGARACFIPGGTGR